MTIIKEIGSFKFPGFYESLFSNSDEFIDDETELQYELKCFLDSNSFEVVYEYNSFKEYKEAVCEKYLECYIDKIIEVLPNEIVDDSEFKFEKTDDKTIVISPKFYNYETDKCFCNIRTNNKTLEMIKNHTLNIDGAKEYIRRNFTSYNGFVSFIPNNINDWFIDIDDYEENMLISLLDMLIYLEDCTGFNDIEMETYYDIDKYYYAEPVVYCKDEEIAKKIKKYENGVLNIKTVMLNK